MAEDGCLVGNNFSPRQLEAIDLFALKELNCTEVAAEIGVSKQTISKWRRNTQFLEAIVDRARGRLRAELPAVYHALLKEAKKGSCQHIKIVLDHLDMVESKNSPKEDGSSITFSWNN